MEYIKNIQDLEGVSRPVKDAELTEQVNSMETNISSMNTSISSMESDISSIKTDISNIKTGGAVEKLGTSTVGGTNQPIYLNQGSPRTCNSMVPQSGGVTMTGNLVGPTNTDYTTTRFRNIIIATSLPSASGHNGDLCVIVEG